MQTEKSSIKNWKTILLQCGLALLFLNTLYFSFFFNRIYKDASIQTELSTSASTKIWYVYKNKYSEKRFFSDTITLSPNKKQVFDFKINSDNKIDYIGLFWVANEGSKITITSYNYSVDEKLYKSNKNRNLINYISAGGILHTNNSGVTVESTTSRRNWIMLNSAKELNGKRDYKSHTLIPLLANIIIALCLFIFFFFKSQPLKLKLIKGIFNAENIKIALLLIWAFIMPFWIIVSHVLMIVIVVLTLIHSFNKRTLPQLFEGLKKHVLFFVFYLWIVISSIVSSSGSQVSDSVLDYSYFLLIPIVFQQIDNKILTKILSFLQKGLYVYFFLLLVFTISNYFEFRPDYNFIRFFELNLELFWHTSYISALVLIVFIAKIKEPIKNNFRLILFYVVALAFMYLVNARLPFIVGFLLIGLKVYTYIKKRSIKVLFVTATMCFFLATIVFFLVKEPLKNSKDQSSLGDVSNIDARLSIWKAGAEEIKDNFIFGVGSRNTVDAIAKSIKENANTKFRNYNCHNQFIEIFLAHGVLGFVLLMLIFYALFQRKTIYARSFVLTCMILFLVESYLQRQAGTIFFTFWYCFFFNFNHKENGVKEG